MAFALRWSIVITSVVSVTASNEDELSFLQLPPTTSEPAVQHRAHAPPRPPRAPLRSPRLDLPLESFGYGKFMPRALAEELQKTHHETAETHDAFAKRGGFEAQQKWLTNATGASQESLCIEGKLVPEFWLLGAPKSGTSSMALDLRLAGIPSNAEPNKELHFFDAFTYSNSTICSDPAVASVAMQLWLSLHKECPVPSQRIVVADYTPDNMRLSPQTQGIDHSVGPSQQPAFVNAASVVEYSEDISTLQACVPTLVNNWYGSSGAQLKFVMMLREPLSRYQSSYYFRQGWLYGIPSDQIAPGQFDAQALQSAQLALNNHYDSYFWPSMYGDHLHNWLQGFPPSQFYIIPYLYYLSNGKCMVFNQLSQWFNVPLDCTSGGDDASADNTYQHPALEDDITNSTLALFNSAMQPHVMWLKQQLAAGSQQGMGLCNYTGTSGDLSSIGSWLVSGW